MRKIAATLITAILLSSCGPSMENTEEQGLVKASIQSAYSPTKTNKLIQNAKNTQDSSESNDSLILALDSLTSQAHIKQAKTILKELNRVELNQEQQQAVALITAKICVIESKNRQAITILSSANTNFSLQRHTDIKNLILSQAYLNTGDIERFITTTLKTNILSDEDKNSRIIESLLNFDLNSTEKLLKNTNSNDVKSYIELTSIIKNQKQSITELEQSLQKWQQQYPEHIANKIIDTGSMKKPNSIAILLPFDGPLAKTSNNILQGILATYYSNYKSQSETPNLIIKNTYDTSFEEKLGEITAKNKIDYVIGPIDKDEVNNLTEIKNDATIIALNKSEQAQNNIFNFYLSPSDEASDMAKNIHDRGYHNALIITTNNTWQQKIANKFYSSWEQLGGAAKLTQLDENSGFASALKSSFSIDKSEARAQNLEKIIKEKFKFIPARRNDIDMIFIAANPNDAREIKPLLKYYFAGDIPVFSISTIYNTGSNSYKDKDLNDIEFMDSKWLVNFDRDKNLKQSLQKIWGEDFQVQKRLYAMGSDAYKLTMNIAKMKKVKHSISGATGSLSINNENNIERKLDWLKFKNGAPK